MATVDLGNGMSVLRLCPAICWMVFIISLCRPCGNWRIHSEFVPTGAEIIIIKLKSKEAASCGLFCYFDVGVTLNLRASRITIMKASAITNIPGNPYSSAMPVLGKAVEVATMVNCAAAACVSAAATVAVIGDCVIEFGSGVRVLVPTATTRVALGKGVGVVVGRIAASKVAGNAWLLNALAA